MEQFKLRDLEEFDRDFVTARQASAAAPQPPIQPPVQTTPRQPQPQAQQFNPPPVQAPILPDQMEDISSSSKVPPAPAAEARPLVPIGQKNTIYSPVGADFPDTSDTVAPLNEEDFDPRKQKMKTKPGILAGKIATIVLLCATVFVFILGCFISIFLDNNGSDVAGYCFNEMSRDIQIENNGEVVQTIAQGSLIISKKKEASEYEMGAFVVVPAATTGCDIQVISSIENMSTGTRFTTIPIGAGYSTSNFIDQDQCYGEVNFYIPVLGHLINMAIADTVQMIITCAIFVIFAIVCCAVLVLLESANKKDKKKRREQQVRQF